MKHATIAALLLCLSCARMPPPAYTFVIHGGDVGGRSIELDRAGPMPSAEFCAQVINPEPGMHSGGNPYTLSGPPGVAGAPSCEAGEKCPEWDEKAAKDDAERAHVIWAKQARDWARDRARCLAQEKIK